MTVVFELLLGMGIALVVNSNFKGRGADARGHARALGDSQPWSRPRCGAGCTTTPTASSTTSSWPRPPLAQNVAWIADPATSLVAVAAVDIWKTTPFVALLLLAGLQVIPTDIYEAADVDGANAVQQFIALTLPLLRPAIVVALIFRTLDALRVFDVFYVMFGNRADTQTMAIYAQQTIVAFSDIGYGAPSASPSS